MGATACPLQAVGLDSTPFQFAASLQHLPHHDCRCGRKGRCGAPSRTHALGDQQLNNLMRSGNGLTYPSCWTTIDGQTEYIFDITIRDEGLIVKDATPSRSSDPQSALLQPFDRDKLVNERTFQKATAKIFDWSRGEKCRFYSIIRDGTAPTSKQRYKELRTIVEGHFYPLHLSTDTVARAHKPLDQKPEGPPMGGPYVPVSPRSTRAN